MAKITIEFDTASEQDMVNYKKAVQAPAMYLALAELRYHTLAMIPKCKKGWPSAFKISILRWMTFTMTHS